MEGILSRGVLDLKVVGILLTSVHTILLENALKCSRKI